MSQKYPSEMALRPRLSQPALRGLKTAALACAILLGAGCSMTLEDGYKPHSLDASPDMRKSFYASPFTDSAEAGARDSGPSFRPGK